jgi:ABC-2 type transport system ATP-binding protein
LGGVSFDVRQGEIFGLIGPNGAGKTTLTKIIATMVQPTSGTVLVHGYDSVFDEEQVRLQVGLASAEERSFYWRISVRQNLMFFARLYGMSDPEARRRISDLIELFNMGEFEHRRFGELSTGNKQRMSVMRALIADPPVLLLDEPTRSLDPVAAATMRSVIRALVQQDRPISILLTSHNLSEVEELCSRVAILSDGQIRALDTPKNLKAVEKPTERVHITMRGLGAAEVELLLADCDDLKLTVEGSEIIVSFTRLERDDQLDLVLGRLHDNGASILALDFERTTLLDVIKGYEDNREEQDCGVSRC